MSDYLRTSCEFSLEKAITSSKRIAHVQSSSKPDSIRHFLKHLGFTDSQIRAIVSNDSRILCAHVENTLEPNFNALNNLSYFSFPELTFLITRHPRILTHPRSIPRLEFWKEFLNGDSKKLLLILIRNLILVCQDLDTGIAPKLALLKDYGLSEIHIGRILLRGPGFFRRSVASMEVLLKRQQELGFSPWSLMFVRGVICICGIRIDRFKTRMEFFFKGFGWSEMDFIIVALRKSPSIVCFAEENIRQKMEFLVGRAGCELWYIASHQTLLTLSLKKRLMPRHHVINSLVERERRAFIG